MVRNQPSISSKFYARVFRTKFWRQKLKAETFGFETFWRKDIGKKRSHKMLMKLTPDVKRPSWKSLIEIRNINQKHLTSHSPKVYGKENKRENMILFWQITFEWTIFLNWNLVIPDVTLRFVTFRYVSLRFVMFVSVFSSKWSFEGFQGATKIQSLLL